MRLNKCAQKYCGSLNKCVLKIEFEYQMRYNIDIDDIMQTEMTSLDNDHCRCGNTLKTSRGSQNCSSRSSPVIARILCDKCSPKPGDETIELIMVRRRTPEQSPRRFCRATSAGESRLLRQSSGQDGLKISLSAESINKPRRLFQKLEPIQDTV